MDFEHELEKIKLLSAEEKRIFNMIGKVRLDHQIGDALKIEIQDVRFRINVLLRRLLPKNSKIETTSRYAIVQMWQRFDRHWTIDNKGTIFSRATGQPLLADVTLEDESDAQSMSPVEAAERDTSKNSAKADKVMSATREATTHVEASTDVSTPDPPQSESQAAAGEATDEECFGEEEKCLPNATATVSKSQDGTKKPTSSGPVNGHATSPDDNLDLVAKFRKKATVIEELQPAIATAFDAICTTNSLEEAAAKLQKSIGTTRTYFYQLVSELEMQNISASRQDELMEIVHAEWVKRGRHVRAPKPSGHRRYARVSAPEVHQAKCEVTAPKLEQAVDTNSSSEDVAHVNGSSNESIDAIAPSVQSTALSIVEQQPSSLVTNTDSEASGLLTGDLVDVADPKCGERLRELILGGSYIKAVVDIQIVGGKKQSLFALTKK